MRVATFALCAASVATSSVDPRSIDALHLIVAAAGETYTARPIDLSSIRVRARAANSAAPAPTVLMHGLGDAGSNAGMQSLAQSVEKAHPGA